MRAICVSLTDAQSIISAASGLERSMLDILTSAGLSIYDLYHLTWHEVNFNSGEISVWDIGQVPVERIMTVSSTVMERLKLIKKSNRNAHYVFCDAFGERYTPEAIKGLLERCMSIGGVVYKDAGYNDVWKIRRAKRVLN